MLFFIQFSINLCLRNLGTKSNQSTLEEATTFTRKSSKTDKFLPQTPFYNILFKESKILKISDFINCNYALFVRNSLWKENLQIFNDMFTPFSLNYTHNICPATNHLHDIPQRQTTHYKTYFMTSIASSAWNDLQRNTIENLLECKISEFKKTIFTTYLAKCCI